MIQNSVQQFQKFHIGILLIGTEVAEGQISDTNSLFLSDYFSRHFGLQTLCKMAVRDQPQEIISALNYLKSLSALIICTGGLGPTVDDLTLESAATFLNRTTYVSQKYQELLKNLYFRKGREIKPEHLKMVSSITNSHILENTVGIALGCVAEITPEHFLILLPGVPSEMRQMVTGPLSSWLEKQSQLLPETKPEFYSFRTFAYVESEVDHMLRQKNITDFEILDKSGHIFVRIPILQFPHFYQLKETAETVNLVFSKNILPENFPDIQNYAVHLLKEKKLKVSIAESCTGGALSAQLLSAPGASEVVDINIITYADKAKEKFLKVRTQTLQQNGAVSAEVAYEMARGALDLSQADIGISVTGIAGPDGGSPEKPVGTIYMGFSNRSENNTTVKHFFFPTTREEFCKKVSQVSLQYLLKYLLIK